MSRSASGAWRRIVGPAPPLGRAERRALIAIVVVAGLVRVTWSVVAARAPVGLHDPGLYRFLASALVEGDGYRYPVDSPTAYYPVGYPIVLAGGLAVARAVPGVVDGAMAVTVGINVVCQLLTVVLAAGIARRLAPAGTAAAAGIVAATVVALWPNLILHTAVPLTESLFLALLAAALAVAVGGDPVGVGGDGFAPSHRRLLVVGAVLGVATLVRPVALPVLGALAVAGIAARWGWRPVVGAVALATLAALVVVAPWVVRNVVVMDAAVLSTNTGDNLCMSRRIGGSGGFEFPNPRCNSGPFDGLERPAYEVERDAQGRRLAFAFISRHPGEEARLVARRLVATFSGDSDAVAAVESYGDDRWLDDGARAALVGVSDAWYVVVGGAGAVALLALGRRRDPRRLLVLGAAVAVLLAPLVTFGDHRFKMPAIPFAAVALGLLVADLMARSRRPATTPRPM